MGGTQIPLYSRWVSSTVSQFIQRRLVAPLRNQLTQGVSPHELALSCALGLAIGLVPILGTATLICVGIGLVMRLNQPAIQVFNYAMALPQIALLPVFISWGGKLLGRPAVQIHPEQLAGKLWTDFPGFLSQFGAFGLQALVAWILTAPVLALGVYWLMKRVFQRWAPVPQKNPAVSRIT